MSEENKDMQGNNTPAQNEQNVGEDNQKNVEAKGKTFSQEELDKIIDKRLSRAKTKWEKDSKKIEKPEGEDDKFKKLEERMQKLSDANSALENKNLCLEQEVKRESVNDVVALAKTYMNEDTTMTEAIEKVLSKYPHFKGGNTEGEKKEEKKAWGTRQGDSAPKMSGVEEAFYKRNPDLK